MERELGSKGAVAVSRTNFRGIIIIIHNGVSSFFCEFPYKTI